MVDSLVLLHGWGLNRCVWDSIIDQLAMRADASQVDALNLPGYECPSVSPYTLENLAQVLLLKTRANAVWVGSSLGGMVALQAAVMQPGHIARLVLVGTTPRFVNDNSWQSGTDPKIFAHFARDLEADYAKALHRFLLLQAGRSDQVRQMVRELSQRIDACGRPTAEVLRAGLQCLQQADLRSRLSKIVCPTLVVQGSLDRITPPVAAEYLSANMHDARLHYLHAGHLPFMSHPGEFLNAMDQFLCN